MDGAFWGALCSIGLSEAVKVICYVRKYGTLVKSLDKDLSILNDRLSTVKADVVYFEGRQRRLIKEEVTKWIQRASDEVTVANTFLQATKGDATGCCGDLCQCVKRYQDGKMAEDKAKEMRELKANAEGFNEVYFKRLNPAPMAELWADGYVALPSMDATVEQLKGFLQVGGSHEITVAGIYGVEGIGKTTVAKKFAADVESAGVFKVVVANCKFDDEKIQTQIAERFGFEFSFNSITERAQCLYKTLLTMKVLIVFDNVDHKIDLSDIGVPQPTLQNGCRILVVSRTSKACEAMHSQMNLQIQPLIQEESETFAAQLAIKHKWSNYLLASIPSEKAGLPAEIERLIRNRITPIPQVAELPGGGDTTSSASSGGGTHLLLDADALEIENLNKSENWILDRSKPRPEAVLIRVWFLHIVGKAMGLFPRTNYGAYFVYQLSGNATGFNTNQVVLIVGEKAKLCFLDPPKFSKEKPTRRADKWLEIEMGRFYSDDYAHSVELAIKDHDSSIAKTGLHVHGIELRKLEFELTT